MSGHCGLGELQKRVAKKKIFKNVRKMLGKCEKKLTKKFVFEPKFGVKR